MTGSSNLPRRMSIDHLTNTPMDTKEIMTKLDELLERLQRVEGFLEKAYVTYPKSERPQLVFDHDPSGNPMVYPTDIWHASSRRSERDWEEANRRLQAAADDGPFYEEGEGADA